ncbi:ribulokinase [Anaerocolumna aminovalerica]|jgi:L-ribulokinase|uniref:Ribulokinase n=1 Tax=Anaerocolumna aminovalerica TaxID=1527 RepID=A0A1I5CUT5_9FIRM|nr:ribulokinase [Anaerocolumna aminovalerica]MBU5332149.1 ribulokinase [Anaerocolumna aminovalerica]MDU6265490.1 ribulokinase [Anaerocolumna aminovalerica]SFN90719.1 L-ribulokinase [Anaerocolumna aminovalerica]
MNKKYSIGVDYGTLSGRAVLVGVETGEIIAQAVKEYTHGVMDECLPDGTKLGPDWALQHPEDYLEVLEETIPAVLKETGILKENVIGLAIDFTACTILPIDEQGIPLSMKEKYQSVPHSYVKLWKHHAAQAEANKLNKIAEERGEDFLARYGGKISSEWMIPKIMQILDEAPEIYDATDRFMEATDWVTMTLTGVEKRNSCTAGYKAIWNKKNGYPSKEFFKALDPRLENVVEDKLSTDIYSLGEKAGELTKDMAERIGLCEGTAIGIANVDAHVSLPAVGITEPGKMLMIMGTSTCDILLGTEEKIVPGMCGVVEDGVLPGYFGYESGQSCVGDHFQWFVENCVPEEYFKAAKDAGMNIHQYLTSKASKLKVGESGLLALDWWNGNRSVLVDVDLTGLMIGMTLSTKPEEMYRALIEATAYGKKIIIETFEEAGVPIYELYACGGISQKNPMLLQIYADVTNLPIKISASDQTPALGAAMFGAVAAGTEKGGYDSIFEAAKVMGKVKKEYYTPIPENVETYKKLYNEFKILHDYFGRGGNEVMKRLKAIKAEAKRK